MSTSHRSRGFAENPHRQHDFYRREDEARERDQEEVCDHLTAHSEISASEIQVEVHDAEVTLDDSVPERAMKRARGNSRSSTGSQSHPGGAHHGRPC